jgi:hypothetical protein
MAFLKRIVLSPPEVIMIMNKLKKLLYGPHIFLHLKEANINNQSKHIPSEFGNDKRTLTFIEI